MMHKLLWVLTGLLLIARSVVAQDCADVNGDGHVDVSDMVYMLVEHNGGVPIPTGKGDIDYRQGYNAGDLRYLVDYIFLGGGAPACPPFPPYTLTHSNDTIFLPRYVVPAGSGQFVLPIYMANHTRVGDIVLPMQVSGLGSSIFLDSLRRSPDVAANMSVSGVDGSTAVLAMSSWQTDRVLKAGVNLLAQAYFHYVASPGGTISMDTLTLRPHTFLNYIYSDSPDNYFVRTIGIPKIVVTSENPYPTMTVQPDTLFFQTLVDYPNPDAQQITIQSSGPLFTWSLAKPSWIDVSATSGISGQTIDVTPNIAGMAAGVHYGDVVVSSTGALDSPKKAVVKLTLKEQFPSLDANCDGIFDISDVVASIQYIFGGGSLCNPCTGTWDKEKK